MNDTSSNSVTPLISIVVPAYNEADGIAEFNRRLSDIRAKLWERSEVIYVNDGSRDDTFAILRLLRERDPTISIVNLSRNFGKEIALTAGLDHSHGDAVIVIDADLQDPPELIPVLIKRWREDEADVVFARRSSRAGESWFKKVTAYGFYRVINAISRQRVPVDTGDFRLLSRRAVDAVTMLRERHRFMKGLFAWIGYRQVAVPYERDSRTCRVHQMELLETVEFFTRRDHVIQHSALEGGDVYWSVYSYYCSCLRNLHHRLHNSFRKPGCRVSVAPGHYVVPGRRSARIIGHHR